MPNVNDPKAPEIMNAHVPGSGAPARPPIMVKLDPAISGFLLILAGPLTLALLSAPLRLLTEIPEELMLGLLEKSAKPWADDPRE